MRAFSEACLVVSPFCIRLPRNRWGISAAMDSFSLYRDGTSIAFRLLGLCMVVNITTVVNTITVTAPARTIAIVVTEYWFVGVGRANFDFLFVAVPRRRLIDGEPAEEGVICNGALLLLPFAPLLLLDADNTDGRCMLHDTYKYNEDTGLVVIALASHVTAIDLSRFVISEYQVPFDEKD